MKKLFTSILFMILSLTLVLTGCSNGATENVPLRPSIRLRSNAEQELKVGEGMKIVYSLENITLQNGETNEDKVKITSSNSNVVTVDDWANVEAVGVGQAKVKIALKDDENVFVEVNFTVTKNFFNHANGYNQGNIDFSDEEKGSVTVLDGQSQVLVNNPGQNWLFKTRIDRCGYTNGDVGGTWGVGSFLVNSAYPIGDNMFWLMLGNRGGSPNDVMVRYGGWRYNGKNGQQDNPIDNKQHNIANGVNLTIARLGIRHFMIADFGNGDVVKHSIEIPQYEGLDTYPGAFGQNQKYILSEYQVFVGEEIVNEKLADFQPAESVSINVIDPRLNNNQVYNLSAVVSPVSTVDKSITWSLTKGLDGVSLSPEGILKVADKVTGEVTVRATSSVKTVYDEVTFIIGNKQTAEGLFNEKNIYSTNKDAVTINVDNSLTIAGGDNYIPLNLNGNRWYLSFNVKNTSANINGTQIGIMSANEGYMDYVEFAVNFSSSVERNVSYGNARAKELLASYAPDGFNQDVNVGVLRDNNDYYIIVNGKILKKYVYELNNATPIIFTKGCSAELTNIKITTTESDLNLALADKFYVGGHVTRNDNQYVLAQKDFKGMSNWPPENDYANGLKFRESLTGNYTIEFTMSDIKPMGDTYDGKILVYLRSERTTCSLQFVIKGTKENPKFAIVSNLDDNTWDEYPIPKEIDMTKPIKVKVVKTLAGIEVHLNDVKVFADADFLKNNGNWNENTVCTPGIASFLCGVTITNPVITKN